MIRLAWQTNRIEIKPPVAIKLTRVAPRSLDTDNLIGGAMKGIRDCVADLIIPGLAAGRADGLSGPWCITWSYDQKKGLPKEYSLEIEIFST